MTTPRPAPAARPVQAPVPAALVTAVIATLLALIGVAVTAALGRPATATAAPVTGPVDGLDISAIDAGRAVDLTIHIPTPNPNDDVPPGELPPGGPAGTTFTARRVVGVDLTTSAGWARARALTVAEAQAGSFDVVRSALTDTHGDARITGLPVGLYLVTSMPPNDPAHGYPRWAPFLVTLPTGGRDGWNHSPVVHAKPWPDDPTPTGPTIPSWPTGPTGPAQPTDPQPPGRSAVPTPPNQPGPPGGGSSGGRLPVTGTAIVGTLAAAAVLVGTGLLAIRFGRRRDADSARR